jgi:hypothetical protein
VRASILDTEQLQIITIDLRDSALAVLKAFVPCPHEMWQSLRSTTTFPTNFPANATLIWQLTAENIEQFKSFAQQHRDQHLAILVDAPLPAAAIQWLSRQGIDYIACESWDLAQWLQQRVLIVN